MSRSAKIKSVVLLVLLTAALTPFQNCILSSFTSQSADLSSSNGPAPGAAGLSPTGVQLSWGGVASSTSYNVYNLDQGSSPVATTVFTTSRLLNLQPQTEYAFSVRGSRGTGQYLTDSLGTFSFATWPLFTDVSFVVTTASDSSRVLSWAYAPWEGSTLPASPDATRGARLSCALVPVPANTDPKSINPTAPNVNPLTIAGPLFRQSLSLPLGSIDSSLTYAAQCTASFVDATTSVSKQNFLISPSHVINSCAATAMVGTSYGCSPNVRIPSINSNVGFDLALAETNTCAWAKVVGSAIQSAGTLTASSLGTCALAYRYTVPTLDYESPVITQNITISVPDAFRAFPSFAVRALSGAIAFPHLYSQLTAQPDARAEIHSDVISDFGAGSSFFAGGGAPFPTFDPTAPAMTTTFFYAFPVAAVRNGIRPTGYSLDAVRATWQSTSANEGFARGNLVVPRVQVNNPSFLSATGASTGPSLFNFLANTYTFDGGSNFSPAPLGYFMNSIADRDADGAPISNPWSGIVIERPQVTFNLPSARAIAAFIPPNGIKGSNVVFGNVDPNKTVTGLITASANNSLYYVTNCQNNPSTYANPAACRPPTGAAVPSAVSCFGDVVIDAAVLLVNSTFVTNAGGCRIYATGTVFVQGGLNVINADGTANANALQIMSARAVVLGFSLSSLGVSSSSVPRTANGGGLIDQMFANGSINPYVTAAADGPGAAAAALNSLATDAQVVNLKPIDANNPYATGSQTFQHLALAAPYVFSNYAGVLSGSVIAEIAAFTHLRFDADPALVGTIPFPLFPGTTAPLIVQ